jgi:hypothetical protein
VFDALVLCCLTGLESKKSRPWNIELELNWEILDTLELLALEAILLFDPYVLSVVLIFVFFVYGINSWSLIVLSLLMYLFVLFIYKFVVKFKALSFVIELDFIIYFKIKQFQ